MVDVDALSGVYETQPFGYSDQPVFWNMVVRGRTRLEPPALLAAVKAMEKELGRVASFHMGPRQIDIDILLYENELLSGSQLMLPHPGVMHRPFVLLPLLEIDPELQHPATGERLAAAAAALPAGDVLRLGSADAVLGPGSSHMTS